MNVLLSDISDEHFEIIVFLLHQLWAVSDKHVAASLQWFLAPVRAGLQPASCSLWAFFICSVSPRIVADSGVGQVIDPQVTLQHQRGRFSALPA